MSQNVFLNRVFSDFMIDAVKKASDPLIPEMLLSFQNSTSGQRETHDILQISVKSFSLILFIKM